MSSVDVEALMRERDEARAEVARLRGRARSVLDWCVEQGGIDEDQVAHLLDPEGEIR